MDAGYKLDQSVAAANGLGDLLQVTNLRKYYAVRRGLRLGAKKWVKAVDDVSFTVRKGETLGLVGESGCGKTTIGRAILRLIPASAGQVVFDGVDVFAANRHTMKTLRRKMQIIFQDPYSSLDPRMQVGESVGLGLLVHGMKDPKQREAVVIEALRNVGLRPYHAHRLPQEFSGGERQRIGIARALALNPQLVVCDEAVSALDVSMQSQILNLLRDLQERFGLAYLFIAHNLSVVKHISDRVAVMYLGRIVEIADREELFRRPIHPYTRALLSAVPISRPDLPRTRTVLSGEVPSPINLPPGCRFHTRCSCTTSVCRDREPQLVEVAPNHWTACCNAM